MRADPSLLWGIGRDVPEVTSTPYFLRVYEELGFLKENQLLHSAGDSHPYPGVGVKYEVKFAVSLGAYSASVSAKAHSDSSCGNQIQLALC